MSRRMAAKVLMRVNDLAEDVLIRTREIVERITELNITLDRLRDELSSAKMIDPESRKVRQKEREIKLKEIEIGLLEKTRDLTKRAFEFIREARRPLEAAVNNLAEAEDIRIF